MYQVEYIYIHIYIYYYIYIYIYDNELLKDSRQINESGRMRGVVAGGGISELPRKPTLIRCQIKGGRKGLSGIPGVATKGEDGDGSARDVDTKRGQKAPEISEHTKTRIRNSLKESIVLNFHCAHQGLDVGVIWESPGSV